MLNLALKGSACIFQAVRALSTILFALMALVLPMAGVHKYLCARNIEFSGGSDDCPSNCCDCGGDHQNVPDCMVKADPIPDADFSGFGQISFLKAEEVIFLPLSALDLRGFDVFCAPLECGRAPPDQREWYVKQQRLLI
jgi:hypothetical protein